MSECVEKQLRHSFGYFDANFIFPSSEKNKQKILEVEASLVATGYCTSTPPEDFADCHWFKLTEKGTEVIAELRVKWSKSALTSLSPESMTLFKGFLEDGNDAIDSEKDVHALDELESMGLLNETCEESWDSVLWYYEITTKGALASKFINEVEAYGLRQPCPKA